MFVTAIIIFVCNFLLQDTNSVQTIDIFKSVNVVNPPSSPYPPCYRQPVLFTHPLTKEIFAFATGRNKTGISPTLCSDPGDGAPNYIVFKKSKNNIKSGGVINFGDKTNIIYGGESIEACDSKS